MDAPTTKPKLLIVSFTNAKNDPRVYRQAYYLRDCFEIHVAALKDPEIEGVSFYSISHRATRNPLKRLWRAGNLLAGNYVPFLARFSLDSRMIFEQTFDLVLVNDIEPIHLGFELASGAPVVFDAHEYYPKHFRGLYWNIFHKPLNTRLCRKYIPKCAAMTASSPGFAQAYLENFNVLPTVIYNIPISQDLPVSEVDPDNIRLIHHGAAVPVRQIELMVEMMDHLDSRFSLDLMMFGQPNYLDFLKKKSQGKSNVHWREPVAMQEIPSETNCYDIGVFLIPPATFNLTYTLPNKIFEYMQARLGIAIGPSPGMQGVVEENGLGVIAKDFNPKSLADELNKLTVDDVRKFKENSNKACQQYTVEKNMQTLRNLLRGILEKTQ